MKKVALMTWYNNRNYGTALQAYALQTIIKQYADCDIIPYRSPNPGYSIKNIINPVLRRNLLWKIFDRSVMRLHSSKYSQREEQRRQLMSDYFSRYLHFSGFDVQSESLNELQDQYDAFVCGSDQIWNPIMIDLHFFLDYINKPNCKIAYAPSFGVAELPHNELTARIQDLVNDFSHLSIREQAGQVILKQLTGKNVPICLDPTLLMKPDLWKKLANESDLNMPKEYVYCYLLGRNRKHLHKAQQVAKTLEKELYLQPYYVTDYTLGVPLVPPSGPLEFLNAIMHSSFVCTDSFHGAIFAIMFHKPFVLFRRFHSSGKSSQNSRVETLLKTVGLEDRLDLGCDISSEELLDVSFDGCEERLERVRRASIDYLRNALVDCLKTKEEIL